MTHTAFKKRSLISTAVFILLFTAFSFSQDETGATLSPNEKIKKYKTALETETNRAKIAQAHYEIGSGLEELGRDTEATAEYLKIIINYPDISEVNKKAEAKLAGLYDGFREKKEEFVGRYQPGEGQKDPTVFFAYIKSLYENYRNLGQYERALNVLERLYDMEPENDEYLIDIGDIYLYGYNDPDKAVFHYRKAIEAFPDNPRAYAALGRAYEKKGDYSRAVTIYAKVSEIAPASPWALYSLRRVRGIGLADDRRLVKDWYFIGPFDNVDREGLNQVFPPENGINLEGTYEGKDAISVKWLRPFQYDSSGYVDLNMLMHPNDYVVAYALTYVYSPSEREIQLKLGAEDGIKIWVNDKVVLASETSKSPDVDGEIINATLKKGWNKILLKVLDTWGGWGFYFRITDTAGKKIEDLIFDPIKDEKRRKLLSGKITRQRRFRMTKVATIYALAISTLIFGLYFMISNIYNRIKINRMKEDFVSSVSHELKTPIAAVRMLTETLKRGKVKEISRVGQYYDMIIRESDRLTKFINKILNFSKLEKGGKIFYFDRENVAEIAGEAVKVYRDDAQDEALKIDFESDKKEIFAEVDKDAILQVIINLMDNAYKYSKDEKHITVRVKDAEKNVRVEVEDRGMGIPKESVEKIFDKFYRSERDMISQIKGSGIGLSFVKSVISAHGGRIAVESQLGKGTKFIISLPAEKT